MMATRGLFLPPKRKGVQAAAVRLSSIDFHEMYRDRGPQYALWFTLCIQGRER